MQSYKNLIILGTSHISIDSVNDVKHAINTKHPQIVALELDRPRFESLIYQKKASFSFSALREIGVKGFIFNLLGALIEKKLGKLVGTSPGDEMRAAVKLAYEKKLEIALIDQDIRITLRNISKRMTWREKFRFAYELIFSVFSSKKVKIDLRKVPSKELITKLTNELKLRYPSLYTSLIDDRNKVMAKRLYTLMAHNKNILAIVGAGHEDEILELIKGYKGDSKSRLTLLKPK